MTKTKPTRTARPVGLPAGLTEGWKRWPYPPSHLQRLPGAPEALCGAVNASPIQTIELWLRPSAYEAHTCPRCETIQKETTP